MKRTKFIIIAVVLIVLLAIFALASGKQRSVAGQGTEQAGSTVSEADIDSKKDSSADTHDPKAEEPEESFEPITMEDEGDIVIIVPEDQEHAGQ